MDNYISRLDEIDKWLFDSFGILPGCGYSQENLRHTTARMVAEVLWPKNDLALTWEDVNLIDSILVDMQDEGVERYGGLRQYYEETLKRFNEQRKK